MAGHARLRFCQTHGRVFHVGCIASNSDTFPCISRDGVSEEAYQMVSAEIIKSRRSLGETELTDADHIKTVPINLTVPPAGVAPPGLTILEPEQEASCVEILDAIKFRDIFGHLRTKVEVPEGARSEYGRLCNLILARCLEAVKKKDTIQAERQFKAWCLASTWTLAESSRPQRGGRRGRPVALAEVSERLCFVRQGRWDLLIDQIEADKDKDEDTGLLPGKRPRKVESDVAREIARAVAEIQACFSAKEVSKAMSQVQRTVPLASSAESREQLPQLFHHDFPSPAKVVAPLPPAESSSFSRSTLPRLLLIAQSVLAPASVDFDMSTPIL